MQLRQSRAVVAHQGVERFLGRHVEGQPATEAESDRTDVSRSPRSSLERAGRRRPRRRWRRPSRPAASAPFPAPAGRRRSRPPRRHRAASRSPAPAPRNRGRPDPHTGCGCSGPRRRSPGRPPRRLRSCRGGNHSWVGIGPSSVAISIRRSAAWSLAAGSTFSVMISNLSAVPEPAEVTTLGDEPRRADERLGSRALRPVRRRAIATVRRPGPPDRRRASPPGGGPRLRLRRADRVVGPALADGRDRRASTPRPP